MFLCGDNAGAQVIRLTMAPAADRRQPHNNQIIDAPVPVGIGCTIFHRARASIVAACKSSGHLLQWTRVGQERSLGTLWSGSVKYRASVEDSVVGIQ